MMTASEAQAWIALEAKCPGLVKWDVLGIARVVLVPHAA